MGRPQNRPILTIKTEIHYEKLPSTDSIYGYYADFNVSAEDSIEGIEKSILDKLGKNEVKFEI